MARPIFRSRLSSSRPRPALFRLSSRSLHTTASCVRSRASASRRIRPADRSSRSMFPRDRLSGPIPARSSTRTRTSPAELSAFASLGEARARVRHASPATPAVVAELLRECRLEIAKAMRPYLAPGTPASYLDDLTSDYPLRGGKMMRPGICIATARAFGGSLDDALRTAVAIELLHNAFLVHDDIEDESET